MTERFSIRKWPEGDRVPFDLNTFKYVQVSQAAEIPTRVTPEIKAILEEAGAVFEEGMAR
jgi:hypothetical protein